MQSSEALFQISGNLAAQGLRSWNMYKMQHQPAIAGHSILQSTATAVEESCLCTGRPGLWKHVSLGKL